MNIVIEVRIEVIITSTLAVSDGTWSSCEFLAVPDFMTFRERPHFRVTALGVTHTPHTTRVGWSLVFAANPVNTVNFILTLRVRTTKVPI
jgi:hypothetical protein